MARSFTLAQLTTKAQQQADMENSSLIATAEWQSIISTAFAELHSILAASGMRYFETEQSLTATTTALPSDFMSTVGVEYVVNATTGERQALSEIMAQENEFYAGQSGSQAMYYALVGANIVLYPSISSGTYKHRYVPQPTELTSSSSSTSIDVVTPDGEAFIVWSCVVRALAKEESETGPAVQERERARERVEFWAVQRALSQPRRRMVDDRPMYRDPADYWPQR